MTGAFSCPEATPPPKRLLRLLAEPEGPAGPQEVDSGIVVRVGLMAARQTAKGGLTDAVLRSDVPTPGTALRGMAGIDLDHYPSGAFSLVAQHVEEHPRTRIENRFVQASLSRCTVRLISSVTGRARLRLPGHVPYPEDLVGDHVMVADEGQRGFVGVVEAGAANLPWSAATLRTALRRRLLPCFFRESDCWATARRSAAAASGRGFGTCFPSLVVRNDATPRSIPTVAPVGSSGSAGTSSQDRIRTRPRSRTGSS